MDAEWFRALAARAVAAEPWPDGRFPPSRYYRFLRLLAAETRPALSVELGVCGGGASFHLATGWPGGAVVGVESAPPDPQMRANWDYIEARCPNWVLWRGDSAASAPEIHARHGEAGILFVDTVHTFERTAAELDAWLPFLATRCVVCFDDLHRREMAGFWEWLDWDKVRLDHLHDGATIDEDGFGGGGFGAAWRG